MILAQERSSQKQIQIMEGLEPVMEALVVSYAKGCQEIQAAVSAIKDYIASVEPVQVNREAVSAIAKLEKVFNKKDLFKVPPPQVIQESKETTRLLKDLIEAVELKPLEVNLSNDFTQLEKALGRIEKLIKFEVPLEDGRVAIKLSDKDLEQLSKAMGWHGGGTASEETLQKIAGLNILPHTRIDVTYPSDTTEVYSYKNGSTLVNTVTVTYVDNTKEQLLNVVKS
jgi:hypothetical protein